MRMMSDVSQPTALRMPISLRSSRSVRCLVPGKDHESEHRTKEEDDHHARTPVKDGVIGPEDLLAQDRPGVGQKSRHL